MSSPRDAVKRLTRVISGPLALKMQRLEAARQGALGVEIVTLPQLAARLAGGFTRPATPDFLQPAIRKALEAGGFAELEAVRDLPGMTRAVQRTLAAAWRADAALDAGGGPRLGDLALLDRRVRAGLPAGTLAPPDLCAAAMRRLAHAPRLFGAVQLVDVVDVDPIWRPLVTALAAQVPVTWSVPCEADRRWFPGRLTGPPPPPSVWVSSVVCADPQAEVVEALRWARALMSRGVPAAEIAIAATSPEAWDQPMLVLSRDARLPVHFTHGVAALESAPGQACAALADVLLRGLSQARVRRLLRRSPQARAGLPDDWARGLRRSAGLFTETQWRTALATARPDRTSGLAAEGVLLPRLAQLARGVAEAGAAGEVFLARPALDLWREALRAAPAEALDESLKTLRTPDSASPGAAVSWGPAVHSAAAPRPYVRLLGLTARSWPRGGGEDPLLPEHVLPRSRLQAVSRTEQDERLFAAIRAHAVGELVLSRSRRSSDGRLLGPSRLFPADAEVLPKVRTPAHAFSEADRLLARPQEALERPALALGRAAWRAWNGSAVTAWDGQVPPAHPVIRAALTREQSATSLRRLLRDPLGFVWRYGLGWRPAETYVEALALDRAAFGELVHELLAGAVARLEAGPGLNRATPKEKKAAVWDAAAAAVTQWPAARSVPPDLLWRRTVDEAAQLALAGLVLDEGLQPGTRSWSEVGFGDEANGQPWEAAGPAMLGGLTVGGRIDRLDLRGDGAAARVTDYKSGAPPRNIAAVVLGGGAELQRVTYAAAVRQRTPEVRQVVSRLVYLRGGPAAHGLSGDRLEAAIAEAERFIAAAVGLLAAGSAPPGPDAQERFNPMRLALPADLDTYLFHKSRALAAATGELVSFWGTS